MKIPKTFALGIVDYYIYEHFVVPLSNKAFSYVIFKLGGYYR
jgi:hypothetical protein